MALSLFAPPPLAADADVCPPPLCALYRCLTSC